MNERPPAFGTVWSATLDPSVGREQAGTRPVVVLSPDKFNFGPAGLVVVAPFTRRDRPLPFHIAVEPPEGGLTSRSFIMLEMVRSISKLRLAGYMGALEPETLALLQDRLMRFLDLPQT